MIARAKLEVILGVLAPRFAGGPVEPADPAVDPAPLTSITVERIAVVSVIGTLVARSGYLDAASGLLSYGDIGDAIASRHGRSDRCAASFSTSTRPAARSAGCSTWSSRSARSRPHRQAAMGGCERERAVGSLCDREHCRPALRHAHRRGRLDRRGRGSCRRERRRREGGSRVDIRVRGRKQGRRQCPRAALRACPRHDPGRRRQSLRATVWARGRQPRADHRGRPWNERRRLSRRACDPRRSCRPPGNARSRDCRDGRRTRPNGSARAQHHQPDTEEEHVHGEEQHRTGRRR